MSEFSNVTVVKKANSYFGGGVTSRTIIFPDGSSKTLGIMQPGEYEFSTEAPEVMEIMSGSLTVCLPPEENWQEIGPGEAFEVPGRSRFTVKVREVTDYCCSFIA